MPEWWEQAVIYEIYPRSFADSDGDGIGDLEGIRRRLDHLEWLGVDAIWLTPFYPSPLDDFGYDVADHAGVAPEYGDEESFRRLADAAHARGIRVLLDLVASHTSIEHPWFREHPDRYVWADAEAGPPNNWLASFGGPAWSPDPEDPSRLYLHSFFAEQPDLDWRNPEVREAMVAVVRGWLERGADGFRIDAIDRVMKDAELRDDPPGREPFPLPVHPDQQGWDLIHSRDSPEIGVALAALREAAGGAPLIGEVYLPGPRLGPYLEHLDRVFAFDLLHAPWTAEAIAAVLAREAASGAGAAGGRLAWVLSNHDFSRVATRWGPDSVRAAAMLLLTLPGCAFVYQGEELGQADGPGAVAGPFDRWGRDAFRHPPRWSARSDEGFSAAPDAWLPADDATAPADEQRADPRSVASLYKGLIAARRELDGPLGDVRSTPEGLLTFRRGERHFIALNLGAAPTPAPSGELVLATTAEARDPSGRLRPGAGVLLADAAP